MHTMSLPYRITRPPRAIRKARLDNIALVPANMLPLKGTYQPIANQLPTGSVLIYENHAKPQLQAILTKVAAFFKQRGYVVQIIPSPLPL